MEIHENVKIQVGSQWTTWLR